MARVGKIARLPLVIRDELNQRLRDNETGAEILEWVNGLDVVKEILARHFNSEPINDANLSIWRSGGFADWLKDQDDVESIQRLQEVSLRIAKASGGNLSEGLLALNVGRIQEALEQFWQGLRDIESTEEGNDKDEAVTKLLTALTNIRGMEIETQKLGIKRIELQQKGDALDLEKKKFNHLRVKSFIEWLADEKAKEIATADMPSDAKLEALGQHLFGEAW